MSRARVSVGSMGPMLDERSPLSPSVLASEIHTSYLGTPYGVHGELSQFPMCAPNQDGVECLSGIGFLTTFKVQKSMQ